MQAARTGLAVPFSMTLTSRLLFIVVVSSLSLLTTACGGKRFTASSSTGGGTQGGPGGPGDEGDGTIKQPCTGSLQQTTIPIKLLFVMDTSGSNASNASIGYTGTDNNKVVRGQSLQTFFNTYKNKTNFSWAINVFAGNSSSTLIGSASNQPAFTTNPAVMQSAINNFMGITDGGETPYMAALNLAKTALNNDNVRTAQTKWAVVFISDGRPNPDVDQNTLNAKVAEIIGVIPGQATFNTVYYGTPDATAVSRLQGMATAGGGKFLNTNNSGATFPIEDVITVPGVCP
jgi:hypothetical protein